MKRNHLSYKTYGSQHYVHLKSYKTYEGAVQALKFYMNEEWFKEKNSIFKLRTVQGEELHSYI